MPGTTFNILRYTVDDGPGLRTTVFLKGCPLNCPWCSNPESQKACPEVSFRQAMCVGCGRCAAMCPEHAITIVDGKANIDRSLCKRCMTCVDACLNKAMNRMGEEKTVDDVWKVVRRDRDFYEESGGGVTVSGGEPLTQADFVAELFERFHDEGIHTCLDTTGFASEEALRKVLPHTDLVLFDLKHMDSAKHQEVVGVPNEPIHENLMTILAEGVPVIIRIPYIPGFNDDDENMAATAAFVKQHTPDSHVDILPYHEYGKNKYGSVGMEYPMPPTDKPSDEKLAHSKEFFTNLGLDCQVRV
ncbi:MAG: glycyl-radical enzyme activating protein [Eggerthellaceae bacterium]|nr:glycyl-radical enzyme activating protein [Eggerthellaceae bacterium]